MLIILCVYCGLLDVLLVFCVFSGGCGVGVFSCLVSSLLCLML